MEWNGKIEFMIDFVTSYICCNFVISGELMGYPRDHKWYNDRRKAGCIVLSPTRSSNLLEYRKF